MLVTVYQNERTTPLAADAIRTDPTRMAQGIMTGIGFLGAGNRVPYFSHAGVNEGLAAATVKTALTDAPAPRLQAKPSQPSYERRPAA
jgi:hypothetical protein